MDHVLYTGPENDEDQSSYVTVTHGEGDDAGATTFYVGQAKEVDKDVLDAVKAVEGHNFVTGKAAVEKAVAKADDEPAPAAPDTTA